LRRHDMTRFNAPSFARTAVQWVQTYLQADMGVLATLRLVTRRFRRVIYRIALERFDPACYFARTGSDGGFDSGVRV